MWIAVRAVGFVQPVPDIPLTVVKQCEEFGEIMRDGWGIAVVMTVVVALAVSRFREVDVDVLPLCSASDEIPVAAIPLRVAGYPARRDRLRSADRP